MSDCNEVRLIGSLVRDAEVRYTGSGKAVASFTIVTKVGKATEYHSCVAWEEKADAIRPLSKGAVIGLTGYLKTSSWDDKKTGSKRYKTEVVANNLVIDGADEQPDYDTSAPVTDEDIPF